MVKQLIGRGALSGGVAGLIAFVVARILAEPWIQRAIDYESAREAVQHRLDHAAGIGAHSDEHDLFSRTVQADVGLAIGLVLFGVAMGALVSVGYVVAIGRTGRIRPFQLGLVVPAFFFLGVFLVPFLKYPANPPAIGREDTIRERGALYLIAVAASCLALFLAVYLGQRLHRRLSLYPSVLLAASGFAVVMGVLFVLLPGFNETPLPLRDTDGTIVLPGFPADVLARFRVYAVLDQVVLWGTIALLFAPQAQRLLDPVAARAARESRFAEDHVPAAV